MGHSQLLGTLSDEAHYITILTYFLLLADAISTKPYK